MANEVLEAQNAKVRLEKMKVEMIDRARATAILGKRFPGGQR